MKYRIWGHLKPDTPFAHIFPDGVVPLKGILPIIPREEGAPECYLVPGSELSDAQVEQLATMLWERWRPECSGPEQAAEYIRLDALPLRVTWFEGVGTDLRLVL